MADSDELSAYGSDDHLTAEVVRSLESELDRIGRQDARCWRALKTVLRERGMPPAHAEQTVDGQTLARVVTEAVERAMGDDWPGIEGQVRRMVTSLRQGPEEGLS